MDAVLPKILIFGFTSAVPLFFGFVFAKCALEEFREKHTADGVVSAVNSALLFAIVAGAFVCYFILP